MRAAWLLALAVWTLSPPPTARASEADLASLAPSLDALSAGPAGAGSAPSDLLVLLGHANVSAARLGDALGVYLTAREASLPTPLADWLTGTAFGAEPAIRAKLQEALAVALTKKLTHLLAERGDRLGAAAAVDASLRDTLANTLRLLAALSQADSHLSAATRTRVSRELAGAIARAPYFLRGDVTLDARSRPLLATIRAQIQLILRDVTPLDPPQFVADTGLAGRRATFVLRDRLLVLDNGCLDDAQLDAIEALRSAIPARLRDETFISVHECLGTTRNADGSWALRLHGSRGVNISGLAIGAQRQNQFPEDSESVDIAAFCAVLQHELNHVVDAHGIMSDPKLAARRHELIERSANEPRQLLRSQFDRPGGGHFRNAPQEFFASIANQYLADSRQTLELGYERWLQGYAEPLNQFAFFLDVYSLGSDTSLFFRQDPACRYEVTRVPIRRNANGFVDGVVVDETLYEFRVDAKGLVVPPGGGSSPAGS